VKVSVIGNLGYYELKQHTPWFDEKCSKALGQRKHVKLQLLQNTNETSRTFRTERGNN
jgi:hypothetical protein